MELIIGVLGKDYFAFTVGIPALPKTLVFGTCLNHRNCPHQKPRSKPNQLLKGFGNLGYRQPHPNTNPAPGLSPKRSAQYGKARSRVKIRLTKTKKSFNINIL